MNPSPADRAPAPARTRRHQAFALLTLAVLLAHLALLQTASLLRLPLGGAAAPVTAPMHTRLLAAAEAPAPSQAAQAAPATPPPPPPRPARPRSRATAAQTPVAEETTPNPSANRPGDAMKTEAPESSTEAGNAPEPTPAETVAQACAISKRYLHELFGETNATVAQFIRESRLIAARDAGA